MRTITFSMLLLLSTISLCSFVSPASTQSVTKTTGIETFRVHRQGKDISLTWSAASSAATFTIERSEDGEFFETIYSVESNGARTYKYRDGSYFPGTIYYRIVCTNTDGSEECSAVQSIRIMQRG